MFEYAGAVLPSPPFTASVVSLSTLPTVAVYLPDDPAMLIFASVTCSGLPQTLNASRMNSRAALRAAAVGLAGCGWILGLSRVDRSRRVASAESYEMVAGPHDIAP